jgi:mannan endo-1,4-beta-mannosidase
MENAMFKIREYEHQEVQIKIARIITFLLFLFLITINGSAQEIKVEAESGTLSGSLTIAKSLSGYSGAGYVSHFQDANDKLTLSVPVTVDGTYDIFIGYCAKDGTKTINVAVNDIKSSLEILQLSSKFYEAKFATLNLKEGNIQVIITPSWTWFDIDYVRFNKVDSSSGGFSISTSPVNSAANQNARNLYSFLKDNFLKKNISGVMTLKPLSDATNEITYLKSKTGKEPALLGLDFMDHTGVNSSGYKNNPDLVANAKTWWGRKGIVALCWHWRDPSYKTNAFYTESTTFNINAVDSTESANYKAMIRDMDVVAGYLKELQNAGVAVLWRPLHEASGGWFWWGAKGAAPCIKLWRLMYDRFTNFHQLNNLIWVWTTTDDSKALTWYPGDNYVDILGMDIYPGEYQHGSQVISFSRVKEKFGGKKLITLSECGSIPYPELMQSDGAYWSYFMPWYGDHTKLDKHNSVTDWTKILTSDFVITLDEMPDLKNYTSSSYLQKNPEENYCRVFKTGQAIRVSMAEARFSGKSIRLYDLTGKLLYRNEIFGDIQFDIPLTGLNAGIVLLEIKGDTFRKTFKVVI